jgi:AAA+ superfamily predicted ATPase
MFTTPMECLQAELNRLDLLLHREILRLRATYQLSLDEFRGLYISDEQVDELVDQLSRSTSTKGKPDTTAEGLTRRAFEMRQVNLANQQPDLPWARLIQLFKLTSLEQGLLLLAIAPEVDRKYEILYAYLNNDVTRKSANGDLALRLFCKNTDEQLSLRAALLPSGTLLKNGLIELLNGIAGRTASLTNGYSAAPAVLHFLLGMPPEDPHLAGRARFEFVIQDAEWPPLSTDLRSRLMRVPGLFQSGPGPLIVLEGAQGTGKRAAARAICSQMGISFMRIDVGASNGLADDSSIRNAALQAQLSGCGVYLEHADLLFSLETRGSTVYEWLGPLLDLKAPVFLALRPELPWTSFLKGVRVTAFRFDEPAFEERRRCWDQTASSHGHLLPEPVLDALANRFVLTGNQISAAFLAAVDLGTLSGLPNEEPAFEHLLEGARLQSSGNLGQLAVKVKTIHTWQDLVLPRVTLEQLREVADAIRNSHIVYYHWSFHQRFSEGRGLKVLFSGASGTGKTMTASVIARDLGLELFKIDLSGIVSKYIGETEKNLDRVFEAARTANAIIFFDEADALFGKRSEVKDAHDRYANIELAYLLQKMESHEGAVILATNLSKNIDEAFSRRMHYVVEFPLPDETHREQLWRGMFPNNAPMGADVDFPFLARQFQISGGEIRNAALEAAFLAARDGKVIHMDHLVQAMGRLMIKQGRLPSPVDFGMYFERITH